METHADRTQFVLTARSVTALIPPLVSRCVGVPVMAPEADRIADRLRTIADAEGVPYDDAGIAALVDETGRNLRRAVLALQRVATTEDEVTAATVEAALRDDGESLVDRMVAAAHRGEFTEAVDALDELLIDEGYSGREVLEAVVDDVDGEGDLDPREVVAAVGDVEAGMQSGVNDRIHVESLLTGLD
jgi:replication factor C small subunit